MVWHRRRNAATRMMMISMLLFGGVLAACGDSTSTPIAPSPPVEPAPPANDPAQPQVVLAVFRDQGSGFSTSDVRDVNDQIVQFDTVADTLIWKTDGRSFAGYPVDGNFIRDDRFFQVRFGTENGRRGAYFTETDTATICDIEVVGGRLEISATDRPVPNS